MPTHEHNRRAWDERVRRRAWYIDTATALDFERPLAVVDPCGWLGEVTGRRVLCLAAGGGRHGVLLASAGARVTVVDLSPEMLALDRQLAAERQLNLRAVETSMDDLQALEPAGFDIVVQPVSTCYVPDVVAVYREVGRVLARGGIYVCQHKQPVSLQASATPATGGYVMTLPYSNHGPLPPAPADAWHREAGTVEFLHRWEELLGGLCESGFVIENLAEPRHGDPHAAPGTFAHRSWFVPPYVKIKARKVAEPSPRSGNKLWLPENEQASRES